jgi:surfactin family lipopeptide synthetase C
VPEYMVPAAFVLMDKLPLTPNGKVNRQALPEHDRALSEPEGTYVAPRTPIEEVLAAIWAEILRLERVGVHDNFFELGGHSLLATQVVSRLQETFQVELPLLSLFEAPTVSGLAESIEMIGRTAQKNIVKIAQVLIRLNQLSADEAKAILAERSNRQVEIAEEQR